VKGNNVQIPAKKMVIKDDKTGPLHNLREPTRIWLEEVLSNAPDCRFPKETGCSRSAKVAKGPSRETTPDLLHKQGRGRKRGPTKGRKLKGSITSNCWNGEHSKCYSLNCECRCHTCVRTGNSGRKFS